MLTVKAIKLCSGMSIIEGRYSSYIDEVFETRDGRIGVYSNNFTSTSFYDHDELVQCST